MQNTSGIDSDRENAYEDCGLLAEAQARLERIAPRTQIGRIALGKDTDWESTDPDWESTQTEKTDTQTKVHSIRLRYSDRIFKLMEAVT